MIFTVWQGHGHAFILASWKASWWQGLVFWSKSAVVLGQETAVRPITQAGPFPIGRGIVGDGLAARWPLPECMGWVRFGGMADFTLPGSRVQLFLP